MWPDHRLQELFAIDLPIIQAPMAGCSGLHMARAVAQAGGLGSLACATMSVQTLRQTLEEARAVSVRPLNVNFFAHVSPGEGEIAKDATWLARLKPAYEELDVEVPSKLSTGAIQPFDEARCAVIEELTPQVVSFHFGLPAADLVARVKRAGAKIISSATTVEEARWLEAHGCDAIIAQGVEAGGHRGMFLSLDIDTQVGTFALVPQIADAVNVPTIAAGGIADGRGIAAAFALGASGVLIGTAYLFTQEATINALYRDTLLSACDPNTDRHTTLTNVISGRPTRVLTNRATRELGPMADDAPTFPKGFSALGPLRAKAETSSLRDFSAHYCGQAAALGRRSSAADLTKHLAEDAIQRLRSLSGGT